MTSEDLFEILAREHATMLTAYLRGWIRDPATVDDLFQETLLVAWKTLDRYDKSRPFGPWLRGIAGKLVMAHRRVSAKRDVPQDPEIFAALESRWDAVASRTGDTWDDQLDALKGCWNTLPAHYRESLQVRYRDNLLGPALAAHLGISHENLKKRLQRGLKLLHACIQKKMRISEATEHA